MKRRSIIIVCTAIVIIATAKAQVLIKDSVNYVPHTKLIVPQGALNFIAMGDWGRVGEDHQ